VFARQLSNDIWNWTPGDTKNWTPRSSDWVILVAVVRRRRSGSSTESIGGTRASRSDRHESDAAMRGGCLWTPVVDPRSGVRDL